MRTLFSFLFIALCLAAVVTPASPDVSNKAVAMLSNTSSLEVLDPRFSIDAVFEGPKIPLISVLVSIVEYLVELGLEKFSGFMGYETWKLSEYPEIKILIMPSAEGGFIERRFVIWGLSQAVALMMNSQRFQAATVTLNWKGEKVGRMHFIAWPMIPSTGMDILEDSKLARRQRNTSTITGPASNISLPQPRLNTTVGVHDKALKLRIGLQGFSLVLLDVFRTVIAGLVDSAEKEPTERIRTYDSPPHLTGVQISIYEPNPIRREPPFFETRWLLLSLATLPEFMIQKGKFEEATFAISVDNVKVAIGSIKREAAAPGSLLSSS